MSLSRIGSYAVGILAVVAVKAVVQAAAGGSKEPDSPYVQAMMAEMDRQGITELMTARVKTTDTDEEARQLGMQLAKRGLARLETPDLVLRMRVALALAEGARDSLCAALFIGKPDPDELLASFSQLDSSDLATWVRISISAAKAELTATAPVRPASESELESALMPVIAAGDSTQRTLLLNVFDQPASATTHEKCEAGKTMFKLTLGLPQAERAATLRTLAKLESSS